MEPVPDDISLAEVVRTLRRVEQNQLDLRAELSDELSRRVTWDERTRMEAGRDRQIKELEVDIAALRAVQSKVAWIVLAAVLGAVLALVVGVELPVPPHLSALA